MLFCEVFKIFKNMFTFDRTPPVDCSLCLSVNFQKFFRTCFLQSTSGKLLFHVQVAEFQLPGAVKNYFTGAFQSFYTRTRSSYSKAFIYRLRHANMKVFEKNSDYVSLTSPSCILPSFSQNASRLLFPKRLQKYAITVSLRKYKRKVVLLIIYLFNYDSSKSILFFMLNTTFDVLLNTALVKDFGILRSCSNIKITRTSFMYLFTKK